MRCTEAENGPPCKRCRQGGHEVRTASLTTRSLFTERLCVQCIFEESQRGKRSNRKTDAMVRRHASGLPKPAEVADAPPPAGQVAQVDGSQTRICPRVDFEPGLDRRIRRPRDGRQRPPTLLDLGLGSWWRRRARRRACWRRSECRRLRARVDPVWSLIGDARSSRQCRARSCSRARSRGRSF